MTRVALIGAGGFVGARLVEMAVLRGGSVDDCEFVPIIRQHRGLARLARLGFPDYRLADAAKPETLRRAFNGCEVVVNLTMGDNSRILPDAQNLYQAAAEAGVRSFIHLSSAEVFGRCDTPGLTDDSPWDRRHWMRYARAKGETEDWLRTQTSSGGPRIVVLRPGLIWGPRSGWVAGPAHDILAGTAYLVDGGRWAANLCYVDNLAYSITAVARTGTPPAGMYNVGDPDRPDWQTYYSALAAAMGVPDAEFQAFAEGDYREGITGKAAALKEHPAAQILKRRLRSRTKELIKFNLRRLQNIVSNTGGTAPVAQLTKQMWWLQTTRYHLPTEKFGRAFPLTKTLTFLEAMECTRQWLEFAGFSAHDGYGG